MSIGLIFLIISFVSSASSASNDAKGAQMIKSLQTKDDINEGTLKDKTDLDFQLYSQKTIRLCLPDQSNPVSIESFNHMLKSIRDNDVDAYISNENHYSTVFGVPPQNIKCPGQGYIFPAYVLRYGATNFLPILAVPPSLDSQPEERLEFIKCVKFLIKSHPLNLVVEMLSFDFAFSFSEALTISLTLNKVYPYLNCLDLLFFAFIFDKMLKNTARKILYCPDSTSKLQKLSVFLGQIKRRNVLDFLINLSCLVDLPIDFPHFYFSMPQSSKFVILLSTIMNNNFEAFKFAVSNDLEILNYCKNDNKRPELQINVIMIAIASNNLKFVEFILESCPQNLFQPIPAFVAALEADSVEMIKLFFRYHNTLMYVVFIANGYKYTIKGYAFANRKTEILKYLELLDGTANNQLYF